jgi:geranylgeranyl pyrophosphate synthase
VFQTSALPGSIPAQTQAVGGGREVELNCPDSKPVRERLRAMASDLVSGWRSQGVPAAAKTAAGLRASAAAIVARAGAAPEHIGWTMVTVVSEYWRDRLGAASNGRRLLLLPDCPAAGSVVEAGAAADSMPRTCGPGCGIGTIWAAARDSGWVVEATARAVPAMGGLLTGQYDGILGVAKLEHLEKAFAMLPAFSLPIAAVPFAPPSAGAAVSGTCGEALASAAIDVEWVLGLLGVGGGASAPMGDYLPLLREAADLFSRDSLRSLETRLQMPGAFGPAVGPQPEQTFEPLEATAGISGEFLTRGGKFLRPFIALAAYDAVVADRAASVDGAAREAVKAAAVAIEIFHKSSLVHDDIEDDDRMRYGRPTLHVERGVASAINAGDYLLGLGYRMIIGLEGVDPTTQRDLVAILSEAHVRLARGQGAELWWRDAGDKRLLPEASLEIYGLKTSPAFEAAIAMGIRLAGVQPESAAAVGRYSLHVGTGFQVLNDLKDWAGDVENDRDVAGDLLGGRPTLMWALALSRLPPDAIGHLVGLASRAAAAEASAADVAAAIGEARRLYMQADVFARAAAIVDDQRRQALAALASCRLGRLREVLEFLLDLAVPEQAAAQFTPAN